MMRHFLVALDGSDYAWRALDEAIAYGKAINAEILVLHVVPLEDIPEEIQEFARIENVAPGDVGFAWRKKIMLEDKIKNEAAKRLKNAGVKSFKTLVHEGDPAERILAAAGELNIDMIFVGDRGLGPLHRLVIGSVADKIVNLSKCTCVIVR